MHFGTVTSVVLTDGWQYGRRYQISLKTACDRFCGIFDIRNQIKLLI